MEKKALIKLLNMIPDTIRCNIHGDYNGLGGECNVSIWSGKYLIRGWKSELDNGSSIRDILDKYVCDNWIVVSSYYDDECGQIVDCNMFNERIKNALGALSVDWDSKIRHEIDEYLSHRPTEKQKKFASAINKVLGLNKYFGKYDTKEDYSKFIDSNIDAYKKWMEDNNPSNF